MLINLILSRRNRYVDRLKSPVAAVLVVRMASFTLNSVDSLSLAALVLCVEGGNKRIISDLDITPLTSSNQSISVGLIRSSNITPVHYGYGIPIIDHMVIIRPFNWCLCSSLYVVELCSGIDRKITDPAITDRGGRRCGIPCSCAYIRSVSANCPNYIASLAVNVCLIFFHRLADTTSQIAHVSLHVGHNLRISRRWQRARPAGCPLLMGLLLSLDSLLVVGGCSIKHRGTILTSTTFKNLTGFTFIVFNGVSFTVRSSYRQRTILGESESSAVGLRDTVTFFPSCLL